MKHLIACGVNPRFAMAQYRGVKHLVPSLKKLTVGGFVQRKLSDAEIARNVEMSGGKARRHAPLKFRM